MFFGGLPPGMEDHFGGGGFPGMGGMPGGRRGGAPADTTKLYDTLGVQKDDDEATIKKAYRKLAVKMHPDKGGDPAEFQAIQHAWEILGDEKKRRIYDKHGEEGVEEESEGRGRRGGGGGVKKGPNTNASIKATLEQIYAGNQRSMRITRKVIDKSSQKTCRQCNGQGAVIQTIRMGPMIQQMQVRRRAAGVPSSLSARAPRAWGGPAAETFRRPRGRARKPFSNR